MASDASDLGSVLGEWEKRIRRALEIAGEVGDVVVGEVSRTQESVVGLSSEVPIEVRPSVYLRVKDLIARVGGVLAAVDIATHRVISLRVREFQRQDYSAQIRAGVTPPYEAPTDPRGLVAPPVIKAEPLLMFTYDEKRRCLLGGEAADLAIEPQSPVVVPRPEYIETLIGISGDVTIGALTIGEYVVRSMMGKPVKVMLPREALLYHTFVVGTTGSGKTTFLKNLIKCLLQANMAVVCIDSNADYVQAIFDPDWAKRRGDGQWETKEEYRDELTYSKELYGGPGGLNEIVVLMPVTRQLVENEGIEAIEDLGEVYYRHELDPIVKGLTAKALARAIHEVLKPAI